MYHISNCKFVKQIRRGHISDVMYPVWSICLLCMINYHIIILHKVDTALHMYTRAGSVYSKSYIFTVIVTINVNLCSMMAVSLMEIHTLLFSMWVIPRYYNIPILRNKKTYTYKIAHLISSNSCYIKTEILLFNVLINMWITWFITI